MSVVRVGTNKKYSDNWDNIFGGNSRATRAAGKTKSAKPARQSAKKKPAKKTAAARPVKKSRKKK